MGGSKSRKHSVSTLCQALYFMLQFLKQLSAQCYCPHFPDEDIEDNKLVRNMYQVQLIGNAGIPAGFQLSCTISLFMITVQSAVTLTSYRKKLS